MNNLNQKLNKIKQDKRRILSNYQKERHLELLKRSEELKSLSIDASEEALELSRYSALLQEQLNLVEFCLDKISFKLWVSFLIKNLILWFVF